MQYMNTSLEAYHTPDICSFYRGMGFSQYYTRNLQCYLSTKPLKSQAIYAILSASAFNGAVLACKNTIGEMASGVAAISPQ
jgi:hypothetical protein